MRLPLPCLLALAAAACGSGGGTRPAADAAADAAHDGAAPGADGRAPDGPADAGPLTPQAVAWPEADALFHTDPHWVGADDAYSVDLGGGHVLWLFADSFISPSGTGTRSGSPIVHNTIGIQTGYDPSKATIRFYWGRTSGGEPDAFFPGPGSDYYWPGGGVLLTTGAGERALLLFMMQTMRVDSGLGFDTNRWAALYVRDPGPDPTTWKVETLSAPQPGTGPIVGSASALVVGDRLVAFGTDQSPLHDMDLASWPLAQAEQGDLSGIAYWDGSAWGAIGALQPVIAGGQSELSVHHDARLGRFVEIQTVGFGGTTIGMRTSSAVTGAWPAPQTVYTPPESSRANVLVYAAKGHPELEGADLVLTYASNDSDFGTLVSDLSLYFPRFVRLTY